MDIELATLNYYFRGKTGVSSCLPLVTTFGQPIYHLCYVGSFANILVEQSGLLIIEILFFHLIIFLHNTHQIFKKILSYLCDL